MSTTGKPQRPGHHREEIKAAIRMTGQTLSGLSRLHGYSDSAVGIALSQPWPAVERIIADHLGREPWELWPERYDANHEPVRPSKRSARGLRGVE